MRWMIALVILAVPASAQDACTQESPCVVDLSVDESGFTGPDRWNATEGDWLELRVEVYDDLPHDIAIPGMGLEHTYYPWQDDAVLFAALAGEYAILDDTGDVATLLVAPAPEGSDAPAEDGTAPVVDVPATGALGAMAALAVAIARRR